MRKKILLAENLKFVSDSISLHAQKALIDPDIMQIGCYGDLYKSLAGTSNIPDLVILDLELEGMKNFYSIKGLLQRGAGTNFLIRVPDRTPLCYLRELFEIGVGGVFSLETNCDSLPHIISFVMSGERFIPFDVADALIKSLEGEQNEYNLSRREQEIFTLISIGVSNKEIARYTGIQSSTVKVHNRSIFKKLKVRTRGEARDRYFSDSFLYNYQNDPSVRL